MDFSPKVGMQGLGYRGLDPGLALVGRSAPKHIDLFNLQSDRNSQLFGDTQQHTRRGGVAGQVCVCVCGVFAHVCTLMT